MVCQKLASRFFIFFMAPLQYGTTKDAVIYLVHKDMNHKTEAVMISYENHNMAYP